MHILMLLLLIIGYILFNNLHMGSKQTICQLFACLTSLLQVVLTVLCWKLVGSSCSIKTSFVILYGYRQSPSYNSLFLNFVGNIIIALLI